MIVPHLIAVLGRVLKGGLLRTATASWAFLGCFAALALTAQNTAPWIVDVARYMHPLVAAVVGYVFLRYRSMLVTATSAGLGLFAGSLWLVGALLTWKLLPRQSMWPWAAIYATVLLSSALFAVIVTHLLNSRGAPLIERQPSGLARLSRRLVLCLVAIGLASILADLAAAPVMGLVGGSILGRNTAVLPLVVAINGYVLLFYRSMLVTTVSAAFGLFFGQLWLVGALRIRESIPRLAEDAATTLYAGLLLGSALFAVAVAHLLNTRGGPRPASPRSEATDSSLPTQAPA